jgi:hypothetical protein
MGMIVMTDPKKFKSIGLDIDTYTKLLRICEDEDRNMRQQLSRMVKDEYNRRYGEAPVPKISGIAVAK